MKRLRIAFIALATLVACGAPSAMPVPNVAPPSLAWMAPAAHAEDLLYASNADGTVSVYRYAQRTLVGILTHFTEPKGECSDRHGNIYITDYKAGTISEYKHGGTKAIKVFDDSSYGPLACSVAPDGDLAVANSTQYHYDGNIAIFRSGKSKPIYLNQGSQFIGCAYDDRGDLLALSSYFYSPFWYTDAYYLPRGATKFVSMNLGLYSTGEDVIEGLAWDGKYWIVGPEYNKLSLYTINITATNEGTVVLKTAYENEYAEPVAFYRKSSTKRATQLVAGVGTSNVDYFNYPAGGTPFAQIGKDLDEPYGTAISVAP